MIVDVNEIERCLRYFKAINAADLREIVWVRGGEVLTPEPEQIEEYEFCGLSNKDFPSIVGWMPDDVGIRAVSIMLKTPNVKVRGPEAALSPEAPSRLPGCAASPYDVARCQQCGHEAPHHYAGCSEAR